jgi:hypothetical protein
MEFVSELKEAIEGRVYERVCQYYKGQEDKPPKIQAPDFEAIPLKKPDLKNIDNSWENVVYLFFAKELPACCTNLEDAKNLRKSRNKENGKNCMPTVNEEHWAAPLRKHKTAYCLYVGSCRNKPKDRVKHHLVRLSDTYGLHLGAWWKDEPIELFIMVFGKNIEPE